MKVENRQKTKIGGYDLYERQTKRGWAITILPIGIKIDNFRKRSFLTLQNRRFCKVPWFFTFPLFVR